MGGPGMVLSRETLAHVGPRIKNCLHRNIFSTHEDVEVGRCVRQHAGIACTWNYEMSKMFVHNGTYPKSFAEKVDPLLLDEAIALHPVKIPELQYRLLNQTKSLQIQRLRHKVIRLRKSISDYDAGQGEPASGGVCS